MKFFSLPLTLTLVVVALLAACSEQDSAVAPPPQPKAATATEAAAYDATSWREIIPESCNSFFDGCNTCRRAPGAAEAACTRKACMKYQQPRCLDDEQASAGQAGRQVQYQCAGEARFTVFFGEYRADDQRVKLGPDEVMLSDAQSRTTYKLTRERSASGAKYTDGTLSYWSKGSEAVLQQSGDTLYQGCQEQ
ncbi:MliC family protein [Gilvimarinus agarilyticus]|uniref:MliC family protein n=1 Tax=Gilvimarinus agarilyticus TaxID=679259 RepID=UPI0005A07DD6|nr:MliC family protein [Gilvimarinus agarilyticus]